MEAVLYVVWVDQRILLCCIKHIAWHDGKQCCIPYSTVKQILYVHTVLINNTVCSYSTVKQMLYVHTVLLNKYCILKFQQCCINIQHCWNLSMMEILWSTHTYNKSVTAWLLLFTIIVIIPRPRIACTRDTVVVVLVS